MKFYSAIAKSRRVVEFRMYYNDERRVYRTDTGQGYESTIYTEQRSVYYSRDRVRIGQGTINISVHYKRGRVLYTRQRLPTIKQQAINNHTINTV